MANIFLCRSLALRARSLRDFVSSPVLRPALVGQVGIHARTLRQCAQKDIYMSLCKKIIFILRNS